MSTLYKNPTARGSRFDMDEKKYRIHDVAKRLKMSSSGIRKKENQGEFPPPRRDERNWRYYTEEDVVKLEAYFISKNKKRS